MRTNVDLDDNLIKEAFKITQVKTKKELVNQALRELIESRHRLNLLELDGKIEFSKGYDYKRIRSAPSSQR